MSIEVAGFSAITPLDRGGFGAVFRATRVSTGGTVALKLLDAGPDVDEEVLERRLRREIAALVALKGHPNVVQVEELVIADAGPVIVMEFMDSGSVAKLVDGARLPVERIAHIGTCIASALSAAHDVGIVHRDVKPQNVLANSYGQIKLCDFGIAAIVRSTEVRTRTTSLSVRYASPEELDDDPDVGPPTDVYSLGATLYHLLHGAPPSFRGRSLPDPDATVVRPGGDWARQRLDTIIDWCLQVDPAARPTAAHVHDLLRQFGDTVKQPPRSPSSDVDTGSAATVRRATAVTPVLTTAVAPVPSTDDQAPSSAGWWAATAMLGLVLVGGLVWFLAGRSESTEGAASTGSVASPATSTTEAPSTPTPAEVTPIEADNATTVAPAPTTSAAMQSTAAPLPASPTTVALPAPSRRAVDPAEISTVASSTLASEAGCGDVCTYDTENLLDGDPGTAWSEGVPGLGVGESIDFIFATGVQVVEIEVRPGWQRPGSTCLFQRNGRPRRISVIADSGQSAQLDLQDLRQGQRFQVDLTATTLTFRIDDVFPGSDCDGRSPADDTLISDVLFTEVFTP